MARKSLADFIRRSLGLNGAKEFHSNAFTEEEPAEEKEEKHPDGPLREVNVLRSEINRNRRFQTNKIRTAKYTLLTAFPLSLLTQFHKVSNVYFLFVMTITLIPGASPINPMSSIVPFSLVLGAGIIKDLWVDVKRQRADTAANQSAVNVLRDGRFVEIPSSAVYPGDIMLFRVGDEIKADCVVLNSSLPEGLLYIDTGNLDGETNAKTRRARPETVDALSTVEDIEELAFQCSPMPLKREELKSFDQKAKKTPEQPTEKARSNAVSGVPGGGLSHSTEGSNQRNTPNELHFSELSRTSFAQLGKQEQGGGAGEDWSAEAVNVGGILIVGSAPNADLSHWFGKLRLPSGKSVALGIEQFVPKGCVLRNTGWILAAVVYTGKDTKMLMNYNQRREKYSMVTRHLNYLNICLFGVNQTIMLTMSGMSIWFKEKSLQQHASKTSHSMWYMQYQLEKYPNIVLYWWRYLTNFVLLSYIIPLSLYVTLEFNKAMQLLMMGADRRMAVHDEFTGVARLTKPKTAELNAELAHVRYIFTDKTGTLTENLMTYVGGFVAGGPHDECSNPGGVGLQLRDDLMTRKSVAKKIHVPDALAAVAAGAGDQLRMRESYSIRREVQREELECRSSAARSRLRNSHVLAEVAESELEENPRFRYLRALSLCHSVLCFNVKDVEDAVEEDSGGSDTGKEKDDCCGCCDSGAEDDAKESEDINNLPEAVGMRSEGVTELRSLQMSEGLMCQQGRGVQSMETLSMLKSQDSGVRHHQRYQQEASLTSNDAVLPDAPPGSGISWSSWDNQRRRGGHEGVPSYNLPAAVPFSTPPSGGGYSHGSEVRRERDVQGLRSPQSPSASATEEHLLSLTPCEANPQFPQFGDSNSRRAHFQNSVEYTNYNSPVKGPQGYHHRVSTSGGFGSIAGGHPRHLSSSKLHGRTNSASYYYHQFSSSIAQARMEASFGSLFAASLEQCIDRSKFYEGQSLDEVALVNAARENGFSLLDRSTRTLRVKMLDTIRCYTIIADNEFTPQRKLMSILLKRDPKSDKKDPSQSANLTRSFHRSTVQNGQGSEGESEGRSPLQSRSPSGSNTAALFARPTSIYRETSEREGPVDSDDDDEDDDQVGEPDSKYLLLVKGADNSMMDIVNTKNPENMKLIRPLMQNLEESAKSGLRTLVLGQRFVSNEEVEEWLPMLEKAMCSMEHRSARLHEAYACIERNIDLIGSTSVEDKLQEGVPETLQFFLRASIVLWMLTGDKRETAVTIALTSGLATFEKLDCLAHLNAQEEHQQNFTGERGENSSLTGEGPPIHTTHAQQLERVELQMSEIVNLISEKELLFQEPVVVVVVDGRTLDVIFSDEKLSKQFFDISMKCRSAVCCRMTPIQKAQIVRMFKKHTDHVTLAVGDGANDVSMIQESHIGVGIMGLEGSQAELSSDYAIPKFRFLRRLMMVHGRFSLYRDAHCVLYSIYKNVFLTVSMVSYTTYSGYSGQSFLDSWFLSMFSVVFCSIQPLLVGIIDKDIDDELAESIPELYAAISRENMYFSVPYIAKWLFDGLVEGAFSFFTVIELMGYPDNLYKGKNGCLFDYSTLFFTSLVLVSNLRVILHLVYQNLLVCGVMAAEMLILVVVELLFTSFHSFAGSNWVVYIGREVYQTSMFYVYVSAAVGISLLYTMASCMYIQIFSPWRNAPFAMLTSFRSPYVGEFEETKRKLLIEYDQRQQYQKECDRIARLIEEEEASPSL